MSSSIDSVRVTIIDGLVGNDWFSYVFAQHCTLLE